MDWAEALTTGTTAASAYAILRGVLRAVGRKWRAGPGSRRVWEGRLNSLACGITLARAAELLGPALLQRSLPVAHPWDDIGDTDNAVRDDRRRRPRPWWRWLGRPGSARISAAPRGDRRHHAISDAAPQNAPQGQWRQQNLREWVHRTPHAWVQLLSDDDVVVRLAITVTDPKFAPRVARLTHGMLDLRLGRDTFAASGEQPQGTHPWIGSRRAGYEEWFWFGNPGNYQHYALSWNDAAPAVGCLDIDSVHGAEQADLVATDPAGDDSASVDSVSSMGQGQGQAQQRVRERCRPNTVVMTAPWTDEGLLLAEPVGVDHDHVRVLPTASSAGSRRRRRPASDADR